MESQNFESNRRSELSFFCIQCMKKWGLQFSGEDDEDVNEFIKEIEEFRSTFEFSEATVFDAIPWTLRKFAQRWYRTIRDFVQTLEDFVWMIRCSFDKRVEDKNICTELHLRYQEDGEPVMRFIMSFKRIVNRFQKPPPLQQQIEMALMQLLPNYRRFMVVDQIKTLEDIIKYGRMYELEFLEVQSDNQTQSDLASASGQMQTPDKTSKPQKEKKDEASPSPEDNSSTLQGAIKDLLLDEKDSGHQAAERKKWCHKCKYEHEEDDCYEFL